jgi:hypothetical protein
MKNVFALLALSLTLVACGKDPGVSSGDCQSSVVSDYNSVAIYCGSLRTYSSASSVASCKEKLNSFMNNYPNVNCRAQRLSTGGDMQITSAELSKLKAELDRIQTN